MDFYSILISILCLLPPRKWVPLGQTVGSRPKTLVLLHRDPMASAPHPADKCGHNF